MNGHIVIADLTKYNLIQWFIENVNSAWVYFELHLWMLHNIMWYLNYIHWNTGWVEWHFYVLIPIVICKLTIHRVLHVHVYMNRHINSTQSSYVVSHYRTSSFVKSVIMIFYFLAFDFCSAWSFGVFIPATTANDLRLRRIFYPRVYLSHLFSCLNSWERASIRFLMFSAKQRNYLVPFL